MYTLFRYRNTKLGTIKEYLCDYYTWSTATNNAVKFNSPQSASACYNATTFEVCTQMRIEGPKGGIYRPRNGQYWR